MHCLLEMLQEISRCEKKAGIKVDLDVDEFMKVGISAKKKWFYSEFLN
jgi:hypothetical protein